MLPVGLQETRVISCILADADSVIVDGVALMVVAVVLVLVVLGEPVTASPPPRDISNASALPVNFTRPHKGRCPVVEEKLQSCSKFPRAVAGQLGFLLLVAWSLLRAVWTAVPLHSYSHAYSGGSTTNHPPVHFNQNRCSLIRAKIDGLPISIPSNDICQRLASGRKTHKLPTAAGTA